jgi:23S rRNA pseudouridine2605 synthase
VDGVEYGPIRAELERQAASNAWLKVALTEGKNREVRKVLEHLGLAVNRLIRVAYGPFQLGRLPRGAVEEVPAKVLAEQLGEAGPRKIGTAKAKPKPTRPGGKKSGGKKSGGKKFRVGKPGAGKAKRGPSGAGKAGPKHANRRRPS